jgi:uncharacterized protein (DUF1800 family)
MFTSLFFYNDARNSNFVIRRCRGLSRVKVAENMKPKLMIQVAIKQLLSFICVLGAAANAANCPLNVSGSQSARLTVDGVLLVRYALGSRGAQLTSGIAAPGVMVADAETNVANAELALDIDGDGSFTATDAIVIARSLAGMPSSSWFSGITPGPLATRKNVADVLAHFNAGCPATVSPTRKQASRFLAQATFGAKREDITALTQSTIPQWIEAQFQKPTVSHVAAVADLVNRFYDGNDSQGPLANVESVFRQAAYGDDQLRQRMAWALSQIFVIGESTTPRDSSIGSTYLDILNRNAFGNYRQLLEDITLSSSMGLYLSHMGNEKEDPATGRLPDENYAREIMQLFTIGLWELNPDGTQKLDGQGNPIPTYGQSDIRGLAKVFTGFTYSRCLTDSNPGICLYGSRLGWGPEPAMVPFQVYHSTSSKQFLGRTLAADRSAINDLRDALDAVFNHPNVGPFVAKQLIQRFTTSNPSPAYVKRVAAAFNNNGAGVRGDLKAVIRAILLDPDARDATRIASDPNWGKLREPMVRWMHFLRTFSLPNTEGRTYYDFNRMTPAFGQWPLGAPSIFNFYRPTYSPPGPLKAEKILAPEFQITHEFTAAATHNEFHLWISLDADGLYGIHRDNRQWLDALAGNTAPLVEELDVLLTYGTLSPVSRSAMIEAIDAVPAHLGNKGRAKMALKLFFVSPDYLVLK